MCVGPNFGAGFSSRNVMLIIVYKKIQLILLLKHTKKKI